MVRSLNRHALVRLALVGVAATSVAACATDRPHSSDPITPARRQSIVALPPVVVAV